MFWAPLRLALNKARVVGSQRGGWGGRGRSQTECTMRPRTRRTLCCRRATTRHSRARRRCTAWRATSRSTPRCGPGRAREGEREREGAGRGKEAAGRGKDGIRGDSLGRYRIHYPSLVSYPCPTVPSASHTHPASLRLTRAHMCAQKLVVRTADVVRNRVQKAVVVLTPLVGREREGGRG